MTGSNDDSVVHEVATRLPTREGNFQIHLYKDRSGREHLALVKGEVRGKEGVLTRVHSECLTGDLFGSLRCDCGPQLHHAMRMINDERCGIIVYLRQEGRGIGLPEKLKAYNLQDIGYDTVEANVALGHAAEKREYQAAQEILRDLGVESIRLISNNPDKVAKLTALGVAIDERIPIPPDINPDNMRYLQTKIERMGHSLDSEGLYPFMPEMDDVARYIHRSKAMKAGPFFTIFRLSALDGYLDEEPEDPGGLFKVLRRKLLEVHDAYLPKDRTSETGRSRILLERGGRCFQVKDGGDLELFDMNEIGSIQPSLFEMGIGSVIIEGTTGLARVLLENGMADAMVNVVLPVTTGGRGASHSEIPIRFRDVRSVRLGSETAYYGRPESLQKNQ
jgi:3,4-dihydroxy 2-butanone 4-phosphate synthase/GTP cyclohydrolase II